MRCMSAFMRDAMNACVFGCIIRSCFATRYQDSTLSKRFPANADANPESGIQMKPLLMRDEEFGEVTTAETG
jgi:hypothetical protein